MSAEGSVAGRRSRAAIAYHDEEQDDGAEGRERREDSLQRAVTDLNNDSQLASRVEYQRTKSSGLLPERDVWREERGRG